MTNSNTKSPVSTCLSYRRAHEAIKWLCHVFGFKEHAVYEDEDGNVVHAELTLGAGMIMLGTLTGSNPYQKQMKYPDEVGGYNTMSVSLCVDDADEVYARAKENGAQMILDIEDKPYGGRAFTCRDPEGNIWSVGTYDPWEPK